jgi:hypothetical protein
MNMRYVSIDYSAPELTTGRTWVPNISRELLLIRVAVVTLYLAGGKTGEGGGGGGEAVARNSYVTALSLSALCVRFMNSNNTIGTSPLLYCDVHACSVGDVCAGGWVAYAAT